MPQTDSSKSSKKGSTQTLESVTIRFAGDSGDGMQLTGTQFTHASAALGNDVATFPDFPAEIRAPAGSLRGVSAFQLCFSSHDIRTPGDQPDVLVAMNPAALKVNLKEFQKGGLIVVNADAFTESGLRKAEYSTNPLEDDSLSAYRVLKIPIGKLNAEAVKELALTKKEVDRSRNFLALGLMYWLYDRPMEPTLAWIEKKFGKKPGIAEANRRALRSGYHYGEIAELIPTQYQVQKADLPLGIYRQITGNQAIALGLATGAHLAQRELFYGSYPITPASEILQELSGMKPWNVKTFQAEDEISAICAAIGASFGGDIAATGTSGPGLALKSEAIGLAVMAELPLVIINVQRAGPSTGMPTKSEQADLFQAVFGRNSECPIVVLAASSPRDCFYLSVEATRIATKYMCPVLLLSDGYLAFGAEPIRIPSLDSFKKFEIHDEVDPKTFHPYMRDEKTLSRPWVSPGVKGLEHRVGGLEKTDIYGHVSYDPENHQKMVDLRAAKIDRVEQEIPPTKVLGPTEGDLLVVSWGSTQGSVVTALEELATEGKMVSNVHLRFINPFPPDLGDILSKFKKILVPEENLGQLRYMLRAKYLVEPVGLNIMHGKPMKTATIKKAILELL